MVAEDAYKAIHEIVLKIGETINSAYFKAIEYLEV